MVVEYLDFIVGTMLPGFVNLLNSLIIAPGVSWLGLCVAVILLCIVIGSVLMRVS